MWRTVRRYNMTAINGSFLMYLHQFLPIFDVQLTISGKFSQQTSTLIQTWQHHKTSKVSPTSIPLVINPDWRADIDQVSVGETKKFTGVARLIKSTSMLVIETGENGVILFISEPFQKHKMHNCVTPINVLRKLSIWCLIMLI